MACVDSIPSVVRCLVSGPPPEGQSVCITPPQGLRFLGCLGCCLPKPEPGQSSGLTMCGLTLCLCCGGPKRTRTSLGGAGMSHGSDDNMMALEARRRQSSRHPMNSKGGAAAGSSAGAAAGSSAGASSNAKMPPNRGRDTRPDAVNSRARATQGRPRLNPVGWDETAAAGGGRRGASSESPF